MDTNYTVFVHLLDEANDIWTQRDDFPGQGLYPTTCWMEGESIRDIYSFDIPLDAEPYQITVEVGMYDSTTGVRLPMFDEEGKPIQDNRFIVETVRVDK
jgi:hypothetical protein